MRNLTPLKAIRTKCLECCNNQFIEVKLCPVEACSLYLLRFGKGIRGKGIPTLKAIRKKCLSCGEGTYADVKNCIITDCPLHPYRFGKRPSTVLKRQNTPEHPSGKHFFEESPKGVYLTTPEPSSSEKVAVGCKSSENRGIPRARCDPVLEICHNG